MTYNAIFKIREINDLDLEKGFFNTIRNISEIGDIEFNIIHAKKTLKEIITENHQIYVALNESEEVVGAITLIIEKKFIHNGGVVGHIEDVVTRRGYEGKGIGRALVKKCIEICRIRGCYKVILNCSDKNVNFYRHLGFKTYDNGMRYDLK